MLVYFLPYRKEQEIHKCIYPNHIRVSGIKISNVLTNETSHIAADTVAFTESANKFSQSLRDSFTDVGYNFLVKLKGFSIVLNDVIVYFEQVYC